MTSKQQRLLTQCGCEVRWDNATRQLYATDASIYQMEPRAVAFPQTAAQAQTVLEAALETDLEIIPRGAGTGLVGGAIGDGLILEFGRHHRRIVDLDLEQRTVRVEPGVVLDQLNAFLEPRGFRFGPDVATSSRATLGGMIANNSSGSHVPVYGTTADHVLELDVLWADGTRQSVAPGHARQSKHAALVDDLVRTHASAIRERTPDDLAKRWHGYALHRWLRQPGNLNDILCGSEGTLAAILHATLRIVPLPRRKGLGLLFFDSVSEAMRATVDVLDLQPAAVEHIDRILFGQTRGQLPFQAARDLLRLDEDPCESILLVEFYEDVEDRLNALDRRRLGRRRLMLTDPASMNRVWAMRKAGLSLLTSRPGPAKPATGIEDTAVRPRDLPDYVDGLQKILGALGLEACFYGHAATGLLHVRPVLDLHQAEDICKLRQVAVEVSALVRQFRGSLAGEHGVGIARTEFLEDQLGPELMGAMRAIKDAFDPHHRLNPGKVVGSGRYRIDQSLRQGPQHRWTLPFQPVLAFAAKDHSFVGNLEQCNGCGGCRKAQPTMCPTFLATGEEALSTRGRANLIRAALERRLPSGADPLSCEEMDQALRYCLSCKACTLECPANVNMALLKAELTHARHQRHGIGFKERLFGHPDWLGRLGGLAPDLANAWLNAPWLRRALSRFAGVTDRRPLPLFAGESFDRWFAGHRPASTPTRGQVLLWDDTFVRHHEPHIGRAAVAVLEAAGFAVELVTGRRCCGRPAFSQGLLDEAARLGRHNLALLGRSPAEVPILFLEPSCWSMFREDYVELRLASSREIQSRCQLFETFVRDLIRREPDALPWNRLTESIVVHAHCHAKSLLDPGVFVQLLERLPERKVRLLDTGCCGMAGAFGFEESTYGLSVQVAGPLVSQLGATPPGTVIVASGTSCRHQIEHLTGAQPKHAAEVLARALPGKS